MTLSSHSTEIKDGNDQSIKLMKYRKVFDQLNQLRLAVVIHYTSLAYGL